MIAIGEQLLFDEGDYEISEIAEKISSAKKDILICGSDAEILKEQLKDKISGKNIFTVDFSVNTAEQLFLIAEKMQAEGKEPLNDYDGPVYLRASEAEVKHNS